MNVDQRVKIAIGDLVIQLQAALARISELEIELAKLQPEGLKKEEKKRNGKDLSDARP